MSDQSSKEPEERPGAGSDLDQGPPVDPFAQVYQSLERARREGDLPEGWYLNDFLVIGVAESFLPENRGLTMYFHAGPEQEMAPHRILGLLKYNSARFEHAISCDHEED